MHTTRYPISAVSINQKNQYICLSWAYKSKIKSIQKCGSDTAVIKVWMPKNSLGAYSMRRIKIVIPLRIGV